MKIRSITIGLEPGFPLQTARVAQAGRFAKQVKTLCEAEGFEVQTLRLATPPFPHYLAGRSLTEILRFAQELEACCLANGVDYCALGPVDFSRPDAQGLVDLLPELIATTEIVFVSACLGNGDQVPTRPVTQAIAGIMKTVAETTPEGFGNLRFAAGIHIRAQTPFFPVAFHAGTPAVALALEAADVVEAVAQPDCRPVETIAQIQQAFEDQLGPLEQRLQRLGPTPFRFAGFDLSPAPGPGSSIVRAIEKISAAPFGSPGTLAAAALVTAALKKTALQHCGYCGLMLPVLEDAGLAERNNQGAIGLSQLLTYSAVCGTGLDTIPLAGNVSPPQLMGVVADVGALGWKLQKPLSVRLLPIPGKRVGERTTFDFPYFVNTKIMAV